MTFETRLRLLAEAAGVMADAAFILAQHERHAPYHAKVLDAEGLKFYGGRLATVQRAHRAAVAVLVPLVAGLTPALVDVLDVGKYSALFTEWFGSRPRP